MNIPGSNSTSANKTTTNANTNKSLSDLASSYAQSQTANVQNETNALLAQYEKIAELQKQGLDASRQQTLNELNLNKQKAEEEYQANARQAYINKMLASRDVTQELAQAGLNTTGVVGTAHSSIENAYGNNLAGLQTARNNSLRDIDNSVVNANLEYSIKENELLAEVEQAKIDMQKYGNELAYNRYQDALNNYMNFKNFEYQQERDKVADSQWQKEYELAKKNKATSSKSSRSGSSGNDSFVWEDTQTESNAPKEDNKESTSATKTNNKSNLYQIQQSLPDLKNTTAVMQYAQKNGMTMLEAYEYLSKF